MNPSSLSSRLHLLCNQLASARKGTSSQPVLSAIDFCFFDDLLTPEEAQLRKEVRKFCEQEIVPTISDYYDKAEFPEPLIRKIGQQSWTKLFAKQPYGQGGNLSLTLLS